jgi:hypothetical protein
MNDKSGNGASEERFEIIFKHLGEMDSGATVEEVEALRRESESIDELRRLSAEFAETPTISYTLT